LFDSKFFPWIDAKYQKRMYRYLFFSIINEKCVDKCNFDVIINFASNINNVIRNPNKSGLLKIDLINNLFAKNIDKLDDEFEIINNDYDNYNNNIIIHNKNDIIELVKNNMTHFAGNMISKKYTIRPHQLFNKNYNSQYKDYYVIMNLILVCYYLCYLEKDLIKNELIDYIRKFYGYVPLEELKKYRRAVTNNVEIFGFEEISLSNKDIQEMFAQFLEFIEKSKTYIDFVKNAFNKNTLKRNMTNSLVGGDENSAIKPNITNLYHINNKYKQKYLEQKLLYLDNKNENLNEQFNIKVKSSYASTMYDGIADDKSLIEITYI